MNYLAHIYLSEQNPKIAIGNFIADGIRGKSYLNYPKKIQQGILLHRHIDTFTDAHPVFRQSTKRLHAKYSHYSGIIVDIIYDHFLAKNWANYCELPLPEYAQWFYNLLDQNFSILPERTQYMFSYMVKGNWLVSYASLEGIENVLKGMDNRTKNPSQMYLAINDIQDYYSEFEHEFTTFFNELQPFSHQKLKALTAGL